MSSTIQAQAIDFAKRYAAHFSSPAANDPQQIGDLTRAISPHYRPGVTFFTNGKISRFEIPRLKFSLTHADLSADKTHAEAAALIAAEMMKNVDNGMGTKLVLEEIVRVDVYSETSALCWLRWTFHPREGSEFAGRVWGFTNIYGYRSAAAEGADAEGWEFVVRDQEIDEFRRATGLRFDD